MRKTFKVLPYGQKIVLIISNDPPNVAARRHGVAVPFERKHARLKVEAATWILPDGKIVVCIKPKAGIDTICHESMHAAFFLAERIGLEWDFVGANEHMAWVVGNVAESIWLISKKHQRSQ